MSQDSSKAQQPSQKSFCPGRESRSSDGYGFFCAAVLACCLILADVGAIMQAGVVSALDLYLIATCAIFAIGLIWFGFRVMDSAP